MKTEAKNLQPWRGGKHLTVGALALLFLVGGLGGWSAFASIAGAVIAGGSLQVAAKQQVVQHPDGGVVDRILVRDGDRVEAGQVLLRFDGSLLRAELSIIENQLYGARVRIARLEAERDGRDSVTFEEALLAEAAANAERRGLLEVQTRLFKARIETRDRQLAQLATRQQQSEKAIAGLEAQKAATKRQLTLIERELKDQRQLFEKGHARAVRVYELERQQAGLQGQIGAFGSEIAETQGRIAEIEIEMLRLDAARREEAIAELRELGAEELDLAERQRVTKERLSRLEVRAPRAGVVLDMSVHALRAVVRPADPILYIVPSDSALLVEARVMPANVDDVYPGQPATLRFSAFNARTTPELEGVVQHVSADALEDESAGTSYYLVKLKISEAQLGKLEERVLVPGMPVDVFLRTGDRSPLSYLAKPFTDYFTKAMREG